MDVSDRSSSPRSGQLQGPRPPRLAVCKDSHKNKARKPTKLIRTKPGDFKALVQRFTGLDASGATATAQFDASATEAGGPSSAPQQQHQPREFLLSPTVALSPAARLASIERSVRPLPPAPAPANYAADFYSSSGADMLDVDSFATVVGPSSRPGILSPAVLPPAASTGHFSPMPFDQSNHSCRLAYLSPFLPSASARAAELEPLFAPSPRSNTALLMVHPIQGKRYTCQDCITSFGFNLCEACHSSWSKYTRRLHQQDTPDHKMKVDNSTLWQWFQRFHGIPEEGPCNMEDKRHKHRSFGLPVSTKKSSSFQGGDGETSQRSRLIDELHGDSGTKLPMEIESSGMEKDNSMHDSPSRHAKRTRWREAESFAISDETNNFFSTRSTYDLKGFTVGFSPSHEIIGNIDDKREEIVVRAIDKLEITELITSHDPTNKRYTIVCIVGADGIGKTTLASLVYCDGNMRISFEARAWLWLSDICDYEELLRSVVASLTGVSCRLNDRDELEELLKEELIGKRFFSCVG